MSLVYILQSTSATHRTYVGCTINLAHRVRQHNGELSGGAKQTERGRPWKIICEITGFRTHNEALKFEFALRRIGRRMVRHWDICGRKKALTLLQSRERWSSTSPMAIDVPLTIAWRDD